MLESKESLKGKGFRSPMMATRWPSPLQPVSRRDARASIAGRQRVAQDLDYPLCS